MTEEQELDLKTLKKQDLVDEMYEIIGVVNFFLQADNAIYSEDLVELRDDLVAFKNKLDYIE